MAVAVAGSRIPGAGGQRVVAPRVLLLTTAHNEARFADALVDGVMSQTRRPDRWIVVDDGSSDGTFEALAGRTARVDWITVVRREPVDHIGSATASPSRRSPDH